jgi:hypothetical protein
VTSDLQRKKQMGLNVAACFFEIEFGQRRVVGTGASDQYVVDRRGQFAEELREALESVASKTAECSAASSLATY